MPDNKQDSDGDQPAAVSSIPLDTDDGGEVVIEQQNAGPGNQVGGGEFKNVGHGREPEDAASDQARLEAEAPVERRDRRVRRRDG